MQQFTKPVAPKSALVSLGADPELFVLLNGKPVSAAPIFPGTKGDEKPLKNYRNEVVGGVIHDNVAVEFTMPPALTHSEFSNSIVECKTGLYLQCSDYAREFLKGEKCAWVMSDVGSFLMDEEQLKLPGMMTFGCSRDYNAWKNGSINPKPDARKVGRLRTAGGHIHVGVTDKTPDKLRTMLLDDFGKAQFIKLLDMSVGQFVASLEGKSPARPSHVARRTMYGAAGCYRPKDYGVEYRSPSAAWTATSFNSEKVFHMVQVLCNLIDKDENPDTLAGRLLENFKLTKEDVIESINQSRQIDRLYYFFEEGTRGYIRYE